MKGTLLYKGLPLFYKDSGRGDALVFLHGFTETSDIWDDFSGELSKTYRIIVIDLPGHGRTGTFGEVHSMEFMAERVKEVLDHLGLSHCIMIGHSMGGYVTLAFARLYPSMLRGMVLFHSQAAADSPEARENRDRMIHLVRADHAHFIHEFIPSLFAPENKERLAGPIAAMSQQAAQLTPASIIAALEGMKQRRDQTDLLAEVPFPVFFVAGKQDTRVPPSVFLQQAVLPVHAEVLLLGRIGHMGFLEARHTILQAMEGFARRVFGCQM